jgi:hypothetical protein
MVAIALAHRLTDDGDFREGWFGAVSHRPRRVRCLGPVSVCRGVLAQRAQPHHEASFEEVAIGRQKLALQRQHPVRPCCQGLVICDRLEL